jgi:Fe-S-cluster containining protein
MSEHDDETRALRARLASLEDTVAGTKAALDVLLDMLAGRELTEGHRRLVERARRAAAPGRRVKLAVYADKYQVPNAEIDCDARMHLCQGRCCAFGFVLSTQDLEDGKVRWEVDDPYVIRHEADGYCAHFDRARGGGCTTYEHRPATCRRYDCREDPRVWIDFAQRIPAPLPEGLIPPRRP